MPRASIVAAVVFSMTAACQCNRSQTTPSALASASHDVPTLGVPTTGASAAPPIAPARRALYERAERARGEMLERLELARAEGAAGLCEALADKDLRGPALDALGVAEGTEQLAPLCDVIKDGSDDDRARAIGAVTEIAARGHGAEPEAASAVACLEAAASAGKGAAADVARLKQAVQELQDPGPARRLNAPPSPTGPTTAPNPTAK